MHCDKLCGAKCCEPLRWALADPDPLNNAERQKRVVVPISGPRDFSQCVATPKQRAAIAVTDPVMLAELISMGLRSRGVGVSDSLAGLNSVVICARGDEIRVVVERCRCRFNNEVSSRIAPCDGLHVDEWLTMLEAKAFLLLLMHVHVGGSSCLQVEQFVQCLQVR